MADVKSLDSEFAKIHWGEYKKADLGTINK